LNTCSFTQHSSCQAGRTQEPSDVFTEALAIAHSIKPAFYQAWALSAVAEALTQAGRTTEALATTHSVKDPDTRAWALRGVAKALA
jgi:hypothetical protein